MSRTVYLASVSGGKDSTAMCLHLQEQGIEYRAVHFDTGWEHPETVRYVREVLPQYIGPIEIRSREPELDERREAYAVELEGLLGFRSPFVRWVLKKGIFPFRTVRFCTQELKVFCVRDLVAEVHEAEGLPVNVVGIRAAESRARAELPEREISTSLDCMVWRPLINWTESQVIEIHRRHGVPPNPLYLRGSSRVGCWPCINARKGEVRLVEESRIAVIERLEAMINELASERKHAKGEELTKRIAMFQRKGHPPAPIREHVQWSRTARGSDHEDYQLGFGGLNDGCLRWGLCDLGDED